MYEAGIILSITTPMTQFIVSVWLHVLQEEECPEVNCVNGNATVPPGSCCPVCGESLLITSYSANCKELLLTSLSFSIQVCDTGHLPGEVFNADCNVW